MISQEMNLKEQIHHHLFSDIVNGVYTPGSILHEKNLMEKYGVSRCFYGHLHGGSHALAMEGLWDGVDFRLVAADYTGFRPYKVIP